VAAHEFAKQIVIENIVNVLAPYAGYGRGPEKRMSE
jgi:hypothetical protein